MANPLWRNPIMRWAKRRTAGNNYTLLIQNIEHEEVCKRLLPDEDDDTGEYNGSDAEEGDENFETSGDDEDAKPALGSGKVPAAGAHSPGTAQRRKRKAPRPQVQPPMSKKRAMSKDSLESEPEASSQPNRGRSSVYRGQSGRRTSPRSRPIREFSYRRRLTRDEGR
ncbi:hypothetical protein LTR17_022441 [Elasticomyces elasticus]|nr:hypothetical protein LTR17_022441 [Elasticomyces elasticus]